jgi:CBS domain-containing protein
MDAELTEIYSFISDIVPFDSLDEAALEQLTDAISIIYMRKHSPLPPQNCEGGNLFIVRKGALSYWNEQEELLGKYGEGDICTVFCLPDVTKEIKVKTEEDSLLYVLNWHAVTALLLDYPSTLAFFNKSAAQRLQHKVNEINDEALVNATLMNTDIGDFYRKPAITIDISATIRATAQKMTEHNISCLLVTEQVAGQEQLAGIVTDKDLRKRCLAQGISPEQSVSQLISRDVLTIDRSASAFDALILMTTKQIHHLPVTENGKLAGMITVTDLMNQEGQNAIHLTGVIHKAQTVAELVELSKLVPKLQVRMAKIGTTADHLGKSISAITSAFTVRLIEMAEKLLGSPPVPYAWVAAGSLARREQFSHSDQDNALILSNQAQPEHDYYFHDLATFVCDGLAACGYIYCPGDVMATNSKWRQPQKIWQQYFEKWVNQPRPKALMHCSIFFDMETIYGESSLLAETRAEMLRKTKGNTLFLAHLTRNALNLRPPLGFFRDFVLEKNGDNKNTLDLKHNGLAPIVDLARIYALSEGICAVNTIERLKQVRGTPSLTKESADNLIDAFEFMGMLRLEHQVKLINQGKAADNYLPPKQISKLEREHLKEAFKVVKGLQDVRQSTYG